MTVELPPSVALVLNEFPGNALAATEVQKKFQDRGFRRDFQDQCLSGIQNFGYADRTDGRTGKFDIYAGQSLNPLSPLGKCECVECRVAHASKFASTACLYADRVVIPDPFSFNPHFDGSQETFRVVLLLKVLRPLLDAGVIVFGPAAYTSCANCAKAVRAADRQVETELWNEFKRSPWDVFRFRYGKQWRMSFGSPVLFGDGQEHRMTFPATKTAVGLSKPNVPASGAKAKQLLQEYSPRIKDAFAEIAHNSVFSALMGRFCRATVATTTRQDATGYRVLTRGRLRHPDHRAELRSVPLPALNRLSPLQVVRLREEAAKALPAFRAKLERDLSSLGETQDDAAEDRKARAVAADLTLAARELQGQLSTVSLPSIRRSENLFATLAVALEIVALSSGSPTAITAVSGSLTALLLAAHRSQRERHEKHEALTHQPAYVLLKAEEIVAGQQ